MELLTTLAVIRVATPEQLAQMLTPEAVSTAYVRRGLRALEAAGLTGRTRYGRTDAWWLTGRGLRAVAASGEYQVRPAASTGQGAAESELIDHALAVTTTALAFARQRVTSLGDIQLELAHPWGTALSEQLTVDLVVTAPAAGHQALLIEVDRGTMRKAAMIRKLRRYAAYGRAGVWQGQRGTIGETVSVWRRVYGRRLPPLLLVLDEEPGEQFNRRLDLIADALAAVEGTERWRIAAAPLKWLGDYGPAGRRIWRRPDDPEEFLALAHL